MEALDDLTVFVLSLLVGFEVISRVPATLHTPLMSAANAVHGVVLVGAVLIGASAHTPAGYALAFLACVFAAANVVGGYAVTDRMLHMFRPPAERAERTGASGTSGAPGDGGGQGTGGTGAAR
ncbi:NAD(P) transhydrogenase subunit alpha [Nocardiopsis chromatogenes]|uniref:NAD(P) transhydrogenase subunit alpha n=1 Tax=Nocardiopsis chromatogenes TaxID=280239 RepID=UPI000345C9DB|nr:NAD(P) transhydrogenase subunit alpha [Nocardiopsis chromatogenes]